MSASITCPNCHTTFEPNEIIREEVEKELRVKMVEWQKKKQQEMDLQLQDEKRKTQLEIEQQLRKSLSADYDNKLRLLETTNKENEARLKEARMKEVEFLQKEQQLKNKEAELELSVQKRLQEERSKLSDDIRKLEEQKTANKELEYQMRMRELEKQLEDQKKLADEMRRKAEQGSMQLQGEIQELALEELLRSNFPFDAISEVGKGIRGADCIQTVRNNTGQNCGTIIYESKRTKDFSMEWIEKLKADKRSLNADVAVIVTQAMPKDMKQFGEKDGVWICSFDEVSGVTHLLRDGIIRIYNATKNEENKGDKMHMLYNYLTSNEFSEQWKAIREGFMSMKLSIQKERDAMEKLWKAREKQLEKVLLNAAHIKGSVEGIAGQDSINLNLLGDGNDELMLD
ncbi:MAG: DUF2130 domain-containing protein [Chitinophagaceae bacterium]|uniref:DUF2130 domain-containing protein n=1 Tax=unclassified Paraflavitalea TaxID=2798305 RepID=UPI003D356A7B|nr:DUF2130 domain-containing protein [Chitinophagaceae bacterium]